MTWGQVFLIALCWIAVTILIYVVLHYLDKLLHFQNHKDWNDLGRAIIALVIIFVPPIGFIIGFLGYRIFNYSRTLFIILIISIPAATFIIWRIYVYLTIKRPLKLLRKEYMELQADTTGDLIFHSSSKLSEWLAESEAEEGYNTFRDKYVRLWGNPYSYLVSEHYIQAEFIVKLIINVFYRLRKVYGSISQDDKELMVDAIIRHCRTLFPPISFRADGLPEGAEKIANWSYARDIKPAGPMTYVFVTFGDGTLYIIRLIWEGRLFNVVRENDIQEINSLVKKFPESERTQIIYR